MITNDPDTNSEALQVAQSAPTTALDELLREFLFGNPPFGSTPWKIEATAMIDYLTPQIKAWNKAQVDKAVVEELQSMREHMYNYYHLVSATMNDKDAIATFDYEFESRIADLQNKQEEK